MPVLPTFCSHFAHILDGGGTGHDDLHMGAMMANTEIGVGNRGGDGQIWSEEEEEMGVEAPT